MAEIKEIQTPEHVAIILDGNGRWAKKRMLPRFVGHRNGAFNLKEVTKAAEELGIKYLTVYCFSTENWKRNEKEVNFLMTTPIKYYKKYKESLFKSNVKMQQIGRRDRLSKEFLDMIDDIEEKTKEHTGITLTLCIDYGGRDDIANAARLIAQEVKDGTLDINSIDEECVEKHLYTRNLPPLDLLIRTSGELRLSNYLLWQMAYSELYFTDTLWPDFKKKDLEKAIQSFSGRTRRFGGLKEDESNKN